MITDASDIQLPVSLFHDLCNIQCVAWAFITKLTCGNTNDSNVFVVSWCPGYEVSWPFQKKLHFSKCMNRNKMYEQNGAIKFQMTLCRRLEKEIRLMTNRLITVACDIIDTMTFCAIKCWRKFKNASKLEELNRVVVSIGGRYRSP